MTFHCWVFCCWVFRRWVFPPLGIPDVGYSVQLPMTFHCWVFRRWAFHCWVFRSFCPEYPTTKIPNFSVGYSGRWVFPPLGIPDVGYSVQLPFLLYRIVHIMNRVINHNSTCSFLEIKDNKINNYDTAKTFLLE